MRSLKKCRNNIDPLHVQAGLVQAGEAIASVPNMLTAICLNTDGLNLVKNSNALDCLIPVLTQPSYIRALNVSLPPPPTTYLTVHFVNSRITADS